MNNSEQVKEFTEGSTGQPCPRRPVPMSKNAVQFIIRMVMSELHEMACTVTEDTEESLKFMEDCLKDIDVCKNHDYPREVDLIAAQADSMVDAYYYMLNVACKHGMNLSKLFDVVHQANMNKRDPQTGKFMRRESDGKVIKPPNWSPPDVVGEIQRQMRDGSFEQ